MQSSIPCLLLCSLLLLCTYLVLTEPSSSVSDSPRVSNKVESVSSLLWDTLGLFSHSGVFPGCSQLGPGRLGSSQESFHSRRGCKSRQSSLPGCQHCSRGTSPAAPAQPREPAGLLQLPHLSCLPQHRERQRDKGLGQKLLPRKSLRATRSLV